MSASKPTFPAKVTGDKLFATEVEELRSVADNHADLIDQLRADVDTAGGSFLTGTYTATAAGQQAIPVANAVIFAGVGIEDTATGSLNPLAYGSGYTYAAGQLTVLAAANVQVGEIIHYQYLVGNLGSAYTLPPATTGALGGVKVGNGLSVSGTGRLSLNIDTNTLGLDNTGKLYVLTTGGNISPAATPTNVTATLTNGGYSAYIAWDAMAGATLYQVYRSVNGGPWGLIVGVPYNYYTDNSGVTQGGSAFVLYRVTAANSLGESNPSTAAQAV